MTRNENPIVWSSEQGDLRKKNSSPAEVNSLPPSQQTVYLHRDSKGRGGKVVSLVKGLVLSEVDLNSLTRQIKQACGSGGTVKDGLIEIQGDHREKIAEVLRKLGYKVKLAGG
jgi:translation initiation factor 1